MDRQRFTRSCCTILIILAALLLFWRFTPPSAKLSLDGEAFSVADGDTVDVSIPFAKIRTISLIGTLERGEMVRGTSTRHVARGIWENDAYGEYTLCINERINCCLVIQADSQTLVYNYESSETTQGIYDMLVQALCDLGYGGQIVFKDETAKRLVDGSSAAHQSFYLMRY